MEVAWKVYCPRCADEPPSISIHPCPVRYANGDKWPCNCGELCTTSCDGRNYLSSTEQEQLKKTPNVLK